MLAMRMNVKDYLTSESEADVNEFKEYWKNVSELMAEARKDLTNGDQAATVEKAGADLKEYNAGFEKLASCVSERAGLVKQVLDVKGPETEQALSRIMADMQKANNSEAVYQASQGLHQLMLGRLCVLKLLRDRNPKLSEKADAVLASMQQNIEALAKADQTAEHQPLLTAIRQNRAEYAKTVGRVAELDRAAEHHCQQHSQPDRPGRRQGDGRHQTGKPQDAG